MSNDNQKLNDILAVTRQQMFTLMEAVIQMQAELMGKTRELEQLKKTDTETKNRKP